MQASNMSASHSLSQSPNLHPDFTYKRQEALWKQLVSAEHRKFCSCGDYTQHFRFPSPVKEEECIRVEDEEGGDGVAVSYHITRESGDEDLEEVMASIGVGDDGDDDLELWLVNSTVDGSKPSLSGGGNPWVMCVQRTVPRPRLHPMPPMTLTLDRANGTGPGDTTGSPSNPWWTGPKHVSTLSRAIGRAMTTCASWGGLCTSCSPEKCASCSVMTPIS